VRVIEHRLNRLRCPDCGQRAGAELPAEVPRGAFGPRLEAAVASLAVRNRVSRRDTVELLGELFGCALWAGTVDAILGRTGDALDSAYEELLGHVRGAAAVNVDATGSRLRGKRRTLWGALSSRAAVFRIAPDRHQRQAAALLGDDFDGVVGSDRWWAYRGFDPARRQLCWSHLIRDFRAHSRGAGRPAAVRRAGARHRPPTVLRLGRVPGRRRPAQAAAAGRAAQARAAGAARARLQRQASQARPRLLEEPAQALAGTFTEIDGVEPTNDRAERGPRGAVIHRKLSLGSQSERGERTIERLLPVAQTCRLQRRSPFAYLTAALGASARGDPIPSLL
jgi:transposase